MRFFSKLVLIFNVSFIITVLLRYIELGHYAHGNKEAVIKLPIVQNTLVIMGYCAIFLNGIFVLMALYLLMRGRIRKIPVWITLFNVVIFIWQVAFHFNFY